ncbi:LysR family transcriptional regulator [Aestuariibacter halophilus]|uniref:LysR family transcriptional regulator n=1 Tax=Fluctibacter halophilus TaxID=226011 RepID=A0ABS8GCY6_9ALTE|nr:LysR family transcriptional regulator [Aestuariibacter halophilus]MCC2618259.1 LysR family transcriptional regulator [Aestuariibacter halophilus]
MKKETLNLEWLKHFLTVAEHLSFTRASLACGAPKSALSKSVKQLEQQLGTLLFSRTSRVVQITEAGRILQRRATDLLADADSLMIDLHALQHNVSGHLKLAAPPLLGRLLTSQILPDFMTQWPDITVSLKSSHHYEDLFKEGIDLAFRMGTNRDHNLIQKPLGAANRVLVAAPSLFERYAPVSRIDHLERYPSVQFLQQDDPQWLLCNSDTSDTLRVSLPVAFHCTDLTTLRHAVTAGMGIGLLPWLLVRDDIQQGSLTHLLSDWTSPELAISLVYREGHNKSARLAAFLEHVQAHQHCFDLRYR